MQEKTLTKVWSGEVIPENYSWKDFHSIFNQTAYWGARYGNMVVRLKVLAEPQTRMWDVAKQANESPAKDGQCFKELLSDAVRSGYYFTEFRAKFNRQEVRNMDVSLPSFRKNSIPVRDSVWRFQDDDCIRLPLFPKGDNREQVVVHILGGYKQHKGYADILERIKSGEYKPGPIRLVKDGRKYLVRITYSFPVKERAGRVMGIDLGIHSPVVCAFYDSLQREYFTAEGRRLIRVKNQLHQKRRQVGADIGKRDKRRGHGKSTKFKPLDRVKKDWNGFVDWWIGHLSNEVVRIANREGVGYVALERLDLSRPTFFGMLFGKSKVKFPIGKFVNALRYKLKEQGVQVVEVEPEYTTQACHACGTIQKLTLEDREYVCDACGVRCDRDYNAAKNIAKKGYNKVVDLKAEGAGLEVDKKNGQLVGVS